MINTVEGVLEELVKRYNNKVLKLTKKSLNKNIREILSDINLDFSNSRYIVSGSVVYLVNTAFRLFIEKMYTVGIIDEKRKLGLMHNIDTSFTETEKRHLNSFTCSFKKGVVS